MYINRIEERTYKNRICTKRTTDIFTCNALKCFGLKYYSWKLKLVIAIYLNKYNSAYFLSVSRWICKYPLFFFIYLDTFVIAYAWEVVIYLFPIYTFGRFQEIITEGRFGCRKWIYSICGYLVDLNKKHKDAIAISSLNGKIQFTNIFLAAKCALYKFRYNCATETLYL